MEAIAVLSSKKVIDDWKHQTKPTTIPGWNRVLGEFVFDYLYNDMLLSDCEVSLVNVKSTYERSELTEFTGNIKSVYMLDNNSEFMFGMFRSLVKEDPIDTRLVRRINKSLTKNVLDGRKYNVGERPGEWRKETYTFGDGKTGCTPPKIASRMTELMTLMEGQKAESLQIAAVSHCLFQNIHPFADGNGRTGRALTNYYLMSQNFTPLIFLNEYKDMYYDALRKFDEDKTNALPLYEYMRLMHELTWKDEDVDIPMSASFAMFNERKED